MELFINIPTGTDQYPYQSLMHSFMPQRHQIFTNQTSSKQDGNHLFLCRYNKIPQMYLDLETNVRLVLDMFLTQWGSRITDYHYSFSRNESGDFDCDVLFLFLDNEILIEINLSSDFYGCYYSSGEEAKIEEIIEVVKSIKPPQKSNNAIFVPVETFGSVGLRSITFPTTGCSIATHFNNNLQPFHTNTVKQLNKPEGGGLLLIYGKSGTGKTSYLKHLITQIDKRVVVIPSSVVIQLLDIKMLTFLANHKNVVLVIENANDILISREKEGQSMVSNILNLCDGLLTDGLHIKIICIFDGNIGSIDNAIARKGRLIGAYEFKELEAEKATNLSNALGYNITYQKAACLADVFNSD